MFLVSRVGGSLGSHWDCSGRERRVVRWRERTDSLSGDHKLSSLHERLIGPMFQALETLEGMRYHDLSMSDGARISGAFQM